MSRLPDNEPLVQIARKLTAAGMRPTRQRVMLGSLLWGKGCRHMTAEMLHAEAQQAHIKVSLATIYNTLHQFTDAGLLHEIVVDAGKSYFDTNADAHHHFLNMDTGVLEDIPAEQVGMSKLPSAPAGTAISSVDVIIRLRAS